jgi:hypothetical protein
MQETATKQVKVPLPLGLHFNFEMGPLSYLYHRLLHGLKDGFPTVRDTTTWLFANRVPHPKSDELETGLA